MTADAVLATHASYDLPRIGVSLLLSGLTAYATFELPVRMAPARGLTRFAWIACGAFSIGTGFWCMHLIAQQSAFVAIACFIAAFILIAYALSRHLCRQSTNLQRNEDHQRIAIALSDQRVTRLQNEALTEEIRERRKAEEELSRLAFYDPVTKLNNRAYLEGRIAGLLEQTRGRGTQRTALLYIDIDNFKSVNDMLGHRYGDSLLVEIADRLRKCMREQDILSRMNGDGFALFLADVHSVDQAFRMARRVLDVIEEPVTFAGMVLSFTASIGVCDIHDQYSAAEDVLRDAGTAMYCAKREGGARAVIYLPSMHDDAVAQLQAKMQLKSAVENNEFELYYQPLVHLRDRSIYGMEALIRWHHPLKGLVGPSEFIDLAEETGHIMAIGGWVLRQACFDLQMMQRKSGHKFLMSLNVSTRQLDQGSFVKDLRRVLQETQIDLTSLQLEITESIFLKDASRIGQIFKDVRSLGVRIAFDDFGTGYSSLSYLERYPIDTLKIDQSFVQNIKRGSVNADIVQLIINLAAAIGMSVSAEGVEKPEHASALLAYGCGLAQGYLYSKPVPLQRMLEMAMYGLPQERKIARAGLSLIS